MTNKWSGEHIEKIFTNLNKIDVLFKHIGNIYKNWPRSVRMWAYMT